MEIDELTKSELEVLLERRRQIKELGYTPDKDSVDNPNEENAIGAACYAGHVKMRFREDGCPELWPWEKHWWRPSDRRRDLVRAGALILAELERLDYESNT